MKMIKGIAKVIGGFFKLIWKIIDKIFITPISRFIYFIMDKLGANNINFEKLFSSKNSVIVISLICAFASFFVIDTKAVKLVGTEATVLSNQKVEAIYNEEVYVVEGIPNSVDITLMGRKSDLYLAKQLGEHTVSLDLSGLGVGTHKVKLKYNNPIQTLEYKLDPSTITVVIYPKVSDVKTISTDIINSDKLKDTLIVSEIELNREEIIVKSSKEKLKQISSVKALIDVSALNAKTAGTYTLENVKLVAYNDNGKELKNIEIVPNKVNATVVLTSPSKEVPIRVVPKGEVKSGSAIQSIETDIKQVTIYGEEAYLNKVNYVPVEIDVTNLSKNKTFKTTIKKPSGIRSVSETNITIKVTIQSQSSKTFSGIPVEFENLNSKYVALATSAKDTKINVLVKGTASVLENIGTEDIKAYVDLTDYTVGTWDVPVKATGSDLKLTYSPKTKTIKIIIKNK